MAKISLEKFNSSQNILIAHDDPILKEDVGWIDPNDTFTVCENIGPLSAGDEVRIFTKNYTTLFRSLKKGKWTQDPETTVWFLDPRKQYLHLKQSQLSDEAHLAALTYAY